MRPVPLEIHIQGFEIANFEARMQAMTRPSFSALNTYATDGKPALLFVPTRKHARLVALDVLTFAAAEGAPRKFLQARQRTCTHTLHKDTRCLYRLMSLTWRRT